IDPITILTNELIPLLDTSSIGNLTSVSVTANLPCDTSNVPKIKIIAGILGNTTNVIDSSSDYTNSKGPRDTCVFTDSITNITEAGIPAINRIFVKNTGSSPVHIPEGVMVTLSGVFGQETTTPSMPSQPDFTDDFSSDQWTHSSGFTSVSSGVFNYDADMGDQVEEAYRDINSELGGNLSDTAFVIRFKLNTANLSQGSTNQQNLVFIGASSVNTDTLTSHDGIFLLLKLRGTGIGSNLDYALVDTDGASPKSQIGSEDAVFTHNLTTETVYVEMKRTSATAYSIELFSDASFTTSIESQTGTVASTQSLRYLFVGVSEDSQTGQVLDGTIDDMQVWNGVTSPP
ncbi:MAG: hypothetical protein HYZ54_07390, partial [Ignavibacteriae bacterium]|nr:hypothetical protein [Ignavibacteriota bacterium]